MRILLRILRSCPSPRRTLSQLYAAPAPLRGLLGGKP
jgi:hypothetical protein